MSDKPDNVLQFRTPSEPIPYMGGTTVSCGEHPTAFKKHRWVKYSAPTLDRYCAHCGLVKERWA